jgi:hypothetical protein
MPCKKVSKPLMVTTDMTKSLPPILTQEFIRGHWAQKIL